MTTKPKSKRAKPATTKPPFADVSKVDAFVDKIVKENKEWLKEMASR